MKKRQTPEQKTVRDFAEMVYSHTDAHNPCAAKRPRSPPKKVSLPPLTV